MTKNQIQNWMILGLIVCGVIFLIGGRNSVDSAQIQNQANQNPVFSQKGEIGGGLKEETQSSENLQTPKKLTKKSRITRYVIPQIDDTWFFRDPNQSCKWVYNSRDGGFIPKSQEERNSAYLCDKAINCDSDCTTNAANKSPVPFGDVACDPVYDFGTQFVISSNIYTCNDRGSAIKNEGDIVRLDVLVTKTDWEKTKFISEITEVDILK